MLNEAVKVSVQGAACRAGFVLASMPWRSDSARWFFRSRQAHRSVWSAGFPICLLKAFKGSPSSDSVSSQLQDGALLQRRWPWDGTGVLLQQLQQTAVR